jgi:hypothetical protein
MAKRKHRRRRAWPKLTAVVHTDSHLILGAVTGTGPSQDSPDLIPAMRQAAALLPIDTALADAGYDAEHNHRLCREELGVRRSVIKLNPRNTGRRWPRTAYRREMRQRFPQALYHQRWHAESVFSRHKRRLGSALTTRRTASQERELILRVLTHNLMLLYRRRSGFQQSINGSKGHTIARGLSLRSAGCGIRSEESGPRRGSTIRLPTLQPPEGGGIRGCFTHRTCTRTMPPSTTWF